MSKTRAYSKAEEKIDRARRANAKELDLSRFRLNKLPESLGTLKQLQVLNLANNHITILPGFLRELTHLRELYLRNVPLRELPEWIVELNQLQVLALVDTQITSLPDSLGKLRNLRRLYLDGIPLGVLPKWISKLTFLEELSCSYTRIDLVPEWINCVTNLHTFYLDHNNITAIPYTITELKNLQKIDIYGNPLDPELYAAYKEGFPAVIGYLRAKAEREQIILNEAKLIMVGEGEVGKTCLMDALEGKDWQEHNTTHGIDIREIKTSDPASDTELTLNGWDFGGQRVYRPTHQLFFSSPAVYLVVWKPREGPQQGFVKEWIKLIKHREPDAKILVVATHGGPGARRDRRA